MATLLPRVSSGELKQLLPYRYCSCIHLYSSGVRARDTLQSLPLAPRSIRVSMDSAVCVRPHSQHANWSWRTSVWTASLECTYWELSHLVSSNTKIQMNASCRWFDLFRSVQFSLFCYYHHHHHHHHFNPRKLADRTQPNSVQLKDIPKMYRNIYWLLYISDLCFVLFLCTTAVWQFAINEYDMLCYVITLSLILVFL